MLGKYLYSIIYFVQAFLYKEEALLSVLALSLCEPVGVSVSKESAVDLIHMCLQTPIDITKFN